MSHQPETSLDFDNTVGTEDRFAIRHFMADFVDAVNNQGKTEIASKLAPSAIAEGFSEFTLQQPALVEMFYQNFFGRRHNYITTPKLKLTFHNHLFHLHGDYEEYQEGILSAAGTIELDVVKQDTDYQITRIKFYPRMRAVQSLWTTVFNTKPLYIIEDLN